MSSVIRVVNEVPAVPRASIDDKWVLRFALLTLHGWERKKRNEMPRTDVESETTCFSAISRSCACIIE